MQIINGEIKLASLYYDGNLIWRNGCKHFN